MKTTEPSWSIGETRALAIKAARGAGMPWGMAEEAGFACSWLERHGLPGVSALSALLGCRSAEQALSPTLVSRLDPANLEVPPETHTQTLQESQVDLVNLPGTQVYCPVLVGTLISDALVSDPLEEVRLAQPLLLLPFLFQSLTRARKVGSTRPTTDQTLTGVTLEWTPVDGANTEPTSIAATLHDNDQCDIRYIGQPDCINAALCNWHYHNQLQPKAEADTSLPGRTRVHADQAKQVALLESFASRTYAPETDASRLRGAGAGDDN